MENNSTLCSHLHGSAAFTVESVIFVLLAFISETFNCIFLKVLFNCGGHLPLNTKLLLIHGCIAAIMKSFSFILQSIYNFYLIGIGFEQSSMNRKTCIIISLPYAISTIALLNSMVFIGIERLRSTVNKNLSNIEIVGWRIISAQALIWIASCCVYALTMLLEQEKALSTVCYCYFPMIMSSSAAILNNALFIGTQTLNMLIFCFVYWKNKKVLFEFTMNTARHSLSERFVMWANVKASKMLIPNSIVHAFTYDIVITTNYLLRSSFPRLTDDYLCIQLFLFIMLCTDTMLHPILCLRFNFSLQEIAASFYPKLSYIIGYRRTFEEAKVENDTDSKNVHHKQSKDVNLLPHPHQHSSLHVANVQYSLPPSKSQHSSLGAKKIVEFRVAPEHHQDLLKQMWETSDGKRKNSTKTKIKQVTDQNRQ